MKIKFLTFVSILFILSACSSAPNTTHYYLLSSYRASNADQAADDYLNTKEKGLISVSVTMADYLNQPSVVMQVDNHQIHYARFHMWAEPLLSSTEKSLLQDLNAGGGDIEFVREELAQTVSQNKHFDIKIDYFHIGQDSSVILSGHYSVIGPNDTDTPDKGVFSFQETLSADGYEHAIAQMRHLITKLSTQLLSKL